MTKKKRELIEILLDNVKPEDWPESLPYAAHDKCDSAIYVYSGIPDITSIYNGCWHPGSLDCKFIKTVDVICKFWNKTIVHRDEFMKRWNELIQSATNATTPPAQQEHNTEETKPIQQVSATDTQIGGDHYTKLAIQPMRYSMENGLDALQHTVIKYVTRFRDKNGIEDLEKAKHCIDMLIEFERGKNDNYRI